MLSKEPCRLSKQQLLLPDMVLPRPGGAYGCYMFPWVHVLYVVPSSHSVCCPARIALLIHQPCRLSV